MGVLLYVVIEKKRLKAFCKIGKYFSNPDFPSTLQLFFFVSLFCSNVADSFDSFSSSTWNEAPAAIVTKWRQWADNATLSGSACALILTPRTPPHPSSPDPCLPHRPTVSCASLWPSPLLHTLISFLSVIPSLSTSAFLSSYFLFAFLLLSVGRFLLLP